MKTNLAKNVMERATLLVDSGWIQGVFGPYEVDGQECFCPVGAVEYVAKGTLPFTPDDVTQIVAVCETAMENAIATIDPNTVGQRVPSWNDHWGRTQAEAVAMMEKAQELL